MKNKTPLLFEGFTTEELIARPDEELNEILFCNEVLDFSVGSAQILGKFGIGSERLTLELAQIDGGVEKVLPGIASVAHAIAKKRAFQN